jgi:hypothetical protein
LIIIHGGIEEGQYGVESEENRNNEDRVTNL